jgi:sensor c-di-GMP phosphodiesterase-like protein
MLGERMQEARRRVGAVLTVTLIATLAGGGAGYLLARRMVIHIAEGRLAVIAASNLTEADRQAQNARQALAAMNASPDPYCSDAEITRFRRILAAWGYPREGGRITDGRVDCSTILGRRGLPGLRLQPRYSAPGGLVAYWNPAPLRLDNQSILVLQQGRSFVVAPARIESQTLPASARLRLTLLDPAGQPVNPLRQSDRLLATRSGSGLKAGKLYGTRCSVQLLECVTAELSARSAFEMGRSVFIVCSALMALSGGLLGFFVALLGFRGGTREFYLRRAIRRDLLFLAYQPIVSLADGSIVAAEALARWTDRSGRRVPPDLFVPLAEKEGFVGEITRLALRHVVRDLGSLLRADPNFTVSLNVTAADLADAAFVPMLETTLARAGIPAASVMLEITETSIADHARTVESVHRLRACGHQVFIDDFGTGYSSLAYLRDLSVDGIKIDKIFTQAVGTGSLTVNLLPQILAITDVLGLKVVVEGIETEEQAQYFSFRDKRMRAQGWLYGKPAPLEEFLGMLAKSKASGRRAGVQQRTRAAGWEGKISSGASRDERMESPARR